MKKNLITLLLATLCIGQLSADELYDGFQNPGFEARPRVWWHWMNGNITQEGIRKDLEWMNRVGIAGVHNFDAGLQTPQMVEQRLEYMTPAWKEAYRLAVGLADSLGMEFTIASAPGWSATGGPWVTPQHSMKKLTWREVQVNSDGRQKTAQKIKLPPVITQTGSFADYRGGGGISFEDPSKQTVPEYAEQIAVLAVKRGADDKTMAQLGAKITSTHSEGITLEALTNGSLADQCLLFATDDGSKAWIQYEFPEPLTMKAVTLVNGKTQSQWTRDEPGKMCDLWVSNDGEQFRQLCTIPTSFVPQVSIDIPVTTAKYWRIYIENPKPDLSYAQYGVVVPAAKATNIPEFRLYPVTRINHSEEKAGFAAPWYLSRCITPMASCDEVVRPEDVIDLTNQVDAEGVLTWKVPAGDWTIYRMGWSLTGKQNHPASPEATGLEVDKLDPVAFGEYIRYYLNMYKDAAGGMLGQHGIQYILTDSYEAEQSTWMPTMMEEFEQRRGYKLMPWMPVLTGQIVGSSDASERFLNDWRTTIGELYAENYDLITTIAQKEFGMKGRYTESQENGRVYVADGMDVKRTAQVPMSALWCAGRISGGSTIMMAESDIRESASVAHIYGQNLAAAESFTAMGLDGTAYSYHPGKLKQYADVEFASGLNRVVVHTSPHQPVDSLRPGTGLMIFGQWFHRLETWAEQARVWTDYLARSCYMLQQGHFVADVLWYYGEDSNVCALYGDVGSAPVPAGYAYDFCSPHALMHEVEASEGVLTTRSGMRYRVLALDPNVRFMSLPMLRKIAELARAGVIVCGSKPEYNSSLVGDQTEWDRLVAETWYGDRENVTCGKELIDVLEGAGIMPDVTYAKQGFLRLPYVHRTLDDKEIYWVKNPTRQALDIDVTFRTQGRKPQLWHPESGQVEDASYRMTDDGRTIVRLPMVCEDALFVVFDKPTDVHALSLPRREEHVLTTIEGPWLLNFAAGLGAPEEAVFEELTSLSTHAEPGIRYFSGTTTYCNGFTLGKKEVQAHGQFVLDLGEVCDLAEVIVNGQSLGVCWKYPYRCDITSAVHAGCNTVEIRVTNTWRNRLIGDKQADCPKKITYASYDGFVRADTPLLPSGLLGPVTIIVE